MSPKSAAAPTKGSALPPAISTRQKLIGSALLGFLVVSAMLSMIWSSRESNIEATNVPMTPSSANIPSWHALLCSCATIIVVRKLDILSWFSQPDSLKTTLVNSDEFEARRSLQEEELVAFASLLSTIAATAAKAATVTPLVPPMRDAQVWTSPNRPICSTGVQIAIESVDAMTCDEKRIFVDFDCQTENFPDDTMLLLEASSRAQLDSVARVMLDDHEDQLVAALASVMIVVEMASEALSVLRTRTPLVCAMSPQCDTDSPIDAESADAAAQCDVQVLHQSQSCQCDEVHGLAADVRDFGCNAVPRSLEATVQTMTSLTTTSSVNTDPVMESAKVYCQRETQHEQCKMSTATAAVMAVPDGRDIACGDEEVVTTCDASSSTLENASGVPSLRSTATMTIRGPSTVASWTSTIVASDAAPTQQSAAQSYRTQSVDATPLMAATSVQCDCPPSLPVQVMSGVTVDAAAQTGGEVEFGGVPARVAVHTQTAALRSGGEEKLSRLQREIVELKASLRSALAKNETDDSRDIDALNSTLGPLLATVTSTEPASPSAGAAGWDRAIHDLRCAAVGVDTDVACADAWHDFRVAFEDAAIAYLHEREARAHELSSIVTNVPVVMYNGLSTTEAAALKVERDAINRTLARVLTTCSGFDSVIQLRRSMSSPQPSAASARHSFAMQGSICSDDAFETLSPMPSARFSNPEVLTASFANRTTEKPLGSPLPQSRPSVFLKQALADFQCSPEPPLRASTPPPQQPPSLPPPPQHGSGAPPDAAPSSPVPPQHVLPRGNGTARSAANVSFCDEARRSPEPHPHLADSPLPTPISSAASTAGGRSHELRLCEDVFRELETLRHGDGFKALHRNASFAMFAVKFLDLVAKARAAQQAIAVSQQPPKRSVSRGNVTRSASARDTSPLHRAAAEESDPQLATGTPPPPSIAFARSATSRTLPTHQFGATAAESPSGAPPMSRLLRRSFAGFPHTTSILFRPLPPHIARSLGSDTAKRRDGAFSTTDAAKATSRTRATSASRFERSKSMPSASNGASPL